MNIRSDEIVDGNVTLTLGLVWTIILHFQVGLSNIFPGVIILSILDAVEPHKFYKLSANLSTIELCGFQQINKVG